MRPTRTEVLNALLGLGWPQFDAERAAEQVSGLWQPGRLPWTVGDVGGWYRVARDAAQVSVWDDANRGRAEGLRDLLNTRWP